tara:strand:+ start:137 stop:646 length:510 start_codon:yes stop_codon:yes gene_type:complete
MNFYVGDPCYVIDKDRWGDFCEMLWAKEEESPHNPYGVSLRWPLRDGSKVDVQVFDSPGGDTTWGFDNLLDDEGNRVSLPVDAGLLAIVPIEACERDDMGPLTRFGSVWGTQPELEVWVEGRYVVQLNGIIDNSHVECDECRGLENSDAMMWDYRGYHVCWMCYEEEEE